MPRIAASLTAIEVRRLATPGKHPVGTVPGLRLCVKASGTRSWVLRTMVGRRRAELGLGGFPGVSLAQAIERARAALDQIRAGVDPAAVRRSNRKTIEWTFKKTSEAYIAAHKAGWRNAKHADQWTNTLTKYVYPLFGHKHVRDVTKADVLAAIEPIWSTKNETATRVRNRIELVLSYAVQRDLRPDGVNPARWRGNLDATLPKPSKVAKVEHHPALQVSAMHQFVQRLRKAEGMGARALEFAILTAARSGEVRGATWAEIDLDEAVWRIPKERMKAERAHRVPLSERALKLLETLPRFEGVEFVFPGPSGKPMSDMSLTAVMRRMKADAVPHGFRSTFIDWCSERTNTPEDVREMALAHAIGDKTEEAYRRGDLFEKRRKLMEQWSKFIDTPPPNGNVRVIRGTAA